MKKLLTLLLIFVGFNSLAQVGVSNSSLFAPTETLDVDGTLRASDDIYVGTSPGTNNDIYISNRMIDWDNFTYFVDPAATSRLNKIELSDGSVSGPSLFFNEGGSNTGFYQNADGNIGFVINGTEDMRLTSGHNLGIGTTAPSVKLHVDGQLRVEGMNSSSTNTRIMTTDVNGNVSYRNVGTWTGNTDSQTLSLSSNNLSISGGNSISLASYLDNTDNQNLSNTVSGTNRTINISGGSGTTFNIADNDNSSTNEIQALSISGSTITLNNGGGSVVVPGDNLGNHIATIGIKRNNHNVGHLEGSYNNVGANSSYSNPIYTIGSSYNPTTTALSNMYGIGYAHGNFWGSGSYKPTGWGMYAAADGDIRVVLDASSGIIWSSGEIRSNGGFEVDGNQVIDDGAGWHRSYGQTGWYNGTYGGGWYMTDATWIRSYNNKPVYVSTYLRAEQGLIAGNGGNPGSGKIRSQALTGTGNRLVYADASGTLLTGTPCTHTISLYDTWGDGWNGAQVDVFVNGVLVLDNITLSSGSGPATSTFSASSGDIIIVDVVNQGSYYSEIYFDVISGAGGYLVNDWQPYYDGDPWAWFGLCSP